MGLLAIPPLDSALATLGFDRDCGCWGKESSPLLVEAMDTINRKSFCVDLFSQLCESIYLGWDRPLLNQVAEELHSRFAKGKSLDLSAVDCVLPSLHSCRRLQEILEGSASNHSMVLKLPRFMTVGQLMEALYVPTLPLASDFEQTLAWARAIRSFSSDQLQILVPVLPTGDSIAPWLELAGTLGSLASDLGSQGISFTEVKGFASGDIESRRWDLLDGVHRVYLEELSKAGLSDPAEERSLAIAEKRCQAKRLTILIGTSDLGPMVVQMLRGVSGNLLSMIGAPSSESNRFDEFGSVINERWSTYRLATTGEPFVPAGDMMDQASAVAAHVQAFSDRHPLERITVGVTDESHVAPIELELRGCNVATYRNLGWTLSSTSVGRLLQLVTSFVSRKNWQSLASLVRHSYVHQWITRQLDEAVDDPKNSWHCQLDQLISNHFPVAIHDPLPAVALKNYPKTEPLREMMLQWLKPFLNDTVTVATWSSLVEECLAHVFTEEARVVGDDFQEAPSPIGKDPTSESGTEKKYPSGHAGLHTRTTLAYIAASKFLKRISELNPSLDMECTGSTALEMLTSRLGFLRVVEKPHEGEVDILGWLDLALDNSTALVVNGFNHPFVPSVVSSNPFLPAELRQRLPTESNDRRFARDLYATQLILSSKRDLAFIVGKVGVDQSTTPPSRLIAASAREDLPRRLLHLLEGVREIPSAIHQWDSHGNGPPLGVPELGNLSEGKVLPVKSLSVTAFRDYLICPFRFYLRHVLKMRPVDDNASELAANQFGDLIHGALEDFGKSDDRDESDPERIELLLKGCLSNYVTRWYSGTASSAVQIQVAQAEKRMKAVAVEQASRIADGWRIHEAEASVGPEQNACITVDGQSLPIKGRFDRIDVRTVNGVNEWAILDYKTHGHLPEKKHLRKTKEGLEWIDLQLPLYRMMVPYLGINDDPSLVKLGYFNISAKDEETKVNEASFSDDLMLQAEELVHDCVRNILAGKFEPTQDRVEYDDYESILQTGVASRLLNQVAAGTEEAR